MTRQKNRTRKRSQQTLMLDLRDVYRKVSSNLHDFTPEHLKNIKSVVGLYRGDKSQFEKTVAEYKKEVKNAFSQIETKYNELKKITGKLNGIKISLEHVGIKMELQI